MICSTQNVSQKPFHICLSLEDNSDGKKTAGKTEYIHSFAQ